MIWIKCSKQTGGCLHSPIHSSVDAFSLPLRSRKSMGTSSPIGIRGEAIPAARAKEPPPSPGALPFEAGFAIIVVAVGRTRRVAQSRPDMRIDSGSSSTVPPDPKKCIAIDEKAHMRMADMHGGSQRRIQIVVGVRGANSSVSPGFVDVSSESMAKLVQRPFDVRLHAHRVALCAPSSAIRSRSVTYSLTSTPGLMMNPSAREMETPRSRITAIISRRNSGSLRKDHAGKRSSFQGTGISPVEM